MARNPLRINRHKAGLVVIDVQERLWPAMTDQAEMLQNTLRLIHGAGILQLPIFATEQYRKGLGNTVAEVASAIPGFAPFEKLAFSAWGAAEFLPALRSRNLGDALLCGIEAHVCVCQTCLDLLAEGFRVFVVADAVASRTAENRQVGLDRMRGAGAVVVSTEMVLFELLEKAGTEEFKQVLKLIK